MSPAEPTADDEENMQQQQHASDTQVTPRGDEAAEDRADLCPSCGARILHPIAYYCTTCGGLLEDSGAASADI